MGAPPLNKVGSKSYLAVGSWPFSVHMRIMMCCVQLLSVSDNRTVRKSYIDEKITANDTKMDAD